MRLRHVDQQLRARAADRCRTPRPRRCSMRRRRSESVQLITRSAIRPAFGTITSAPSNGAHGARANSDAPHLSLHVGDLHGVADLDRPLVEQDETRDEAVHHVLQAEADAHAERTGQDRDLRQVDARRSQCQEEGDQRRRVLHRRADRVGNAARQVHPREYILREQRTDGAGNEHREPEREPEGQDVARR